MPSPTSIASHRAATSDTLGCSAHASASGSPLLLHGLRKDGRRMRAARRAHAQDRQSPHQGHRRDPLLLQYNTPTVYNGQSFENIRFVFKNGKIVEATCQGDSKKLNEIFDTDEGARYIGEFAIGFNPHITHAMKDILFDEKIAGSFHFTPGRCYEETNNRNNSEIHWDLVCIQRAEFGGGTISFDGEVIRKDGLFVPTDLQALNPDRLG